MLNRIILIGRLTKDPELRTTNTGKSVASFRIAVDRRFSSSQGERETDFFNVTAWGNTAEFVSNYLSKGRLVAVDGRLQTRSWTGQDGVERRDVEIVADNVQGLDKPKDAGDGGSHGADDFGAAAYDEDDPFVAD